MKSNTMQPKKTTQPESNLSENSKADNPYAESNLQSLKNHLPKALISLAIVVICGIIACFLLKNAVANINGVDGTYVFTENGITNTIQFEKGGKYSLQNGADAQNVQSGTWSCRGDEITLKTSSGETSKCYFVERKYIALADSNFLTGAVGNGSSFEAQVKAADGTVYEFKTDGKFYMSEGGRNTELGSYMTDGDFIVITKDGVGYPYLNCGHGITLQYYSRAKR